MKRIPGISFLSRTPPPYGCLQLPLDELAPLPGFLGTFLWPTNPTKTTRGRLAGPISLAVVLTACACVITRKQSTATGKCSPIRLDSEIDLLSCSYFSYYVRLYVVVASNNPIWYIITYQPRWPFFSISSTFGYFEYILLTTLLQFYFEFRTCMSICSMLYWDSYFNKGFEYFFHYCHIHET